MAISLTSTNTSGAVNVNGVDVLTADAGGNLSLRTAGVTTALADLRSIGIGQTWQNVTASRALSTTYTNTTGRPIAVSITLVANAAGGAFVVTLGGVTIVGTNASGSGNNSNGFFIVPNGVTYSIAGVSASLGTWNELRT